MGPKRDWAEQELDETAAKLLREKARHEGHKAHRQWLENQKVARDQNQDDRFDEHGNCTDGENKW